MKRVDEPLPGLLLLHQPWAVDERGAVRELHREEWLGEADLATMGRPTFVQDNATVSRRGVLRGLHFQRGPAGQGKLIQVVTGQIYDVAVDLRAGSSSYGQHFAINLVAERGMVLWIPPGFAHGFLVRSDQAVVVYKLTAVYDPAAQRALRRRVVHRGELVHDHGLVRSHEEPVGEARRDPQHHAALGHQVDREVLAVAARAGAQVDRDVVDLPGHDLDQLALPGWPALEVQAAQHAAA